MTYMRWCPDLGVAIEIDDSCRCGSGLPRYDLTDARGIFCTYVCDRCEPSRRKEFRADIFTDSNYWTDEPVEAED